MLSILAMLAAGCLIDVAIVAVLAYLTDGRRAARPLYGARLPRPTLTSVPPRRLTTG